MKQAVRFTRCKQLRFLLRGQCFSNAGVFPLELHLTLEHGPELVAPQHLAQHLKLFVQRPRRCALRLSAGLIGPNLAGVNITEKQRTKSKQDMSVIADLVAHFPEAVFRCAWFGELLRTFAAIRNFDLYARRLLLAVSSGFLRAGRKRNWRRLSRLSRLEAGRAFRTKLAGELHQWLKNLDPGLAEESWLNAELNKKVGEIMRANPRLEGAETQLRRLLMNRNAYEASILIASHAFQVRARDLEAGTASF